LPAGESFSETKQVYLPADVLPEMADIMFAFDLTFSMNHEVENVKVNSLNIMDLLALAIEDIRFGVISHMDYPDFYSFDYCGYYPVKYTGEHLPYGYGLPMAGYSADYEYSLDQGLTDETALVDQAIQALTLGNGGDEAEDYGRVMWEASHDANVGWREEAAKFLLYWQDAVPHDCNYNRAADCSPVSGTKGPDPGPDFVPFTEDDILLTDAIQGLVDEGIVLVSLHSGPWPFDTPTHLLWGCYAAETGGKSFPILGTGEMPDDSDIEDYLLRSIQEVFQSVDELELRASAGFEDWVASNTVSGVDLSSENLFEFDVTFTVPSDQEPGVYDFQVCVYADGAALGVCQDVEIIVDGPPTADPNGPYSGEEGSPVSFDGTGSVDPEGEPLTYDWSFGDSNTGSGPTPDHTYADNGEYEVCLTVTDPEGQSDTECTTAVIANVAPCCGDITGLPAEPIRLGTPVSASATFTDPGVDDTHTAQWDWGDGSTSAGTVTEAGGSGSVGPDSHTYSEPGIYEVTLTVTDKDGDECTKTFKYVVVYDPNGGFVTGGGWIESPGGAYKPDPALTGRASFGFVAKYKKGRSTPDGNTEFQFHAAGMNFHSSSYDWLVVTGSDFARFKGAGTINGDVCPPSEGGDPFEFMIWAGDDEPDTFRIKIWCDDGGEEVVYDNGMNQAISGGSIVIHTKGK
jgi:PKD repeat protein